MPDLFDLPSILAEARRLNRTIQDLRRPKGTRNSAITELRRLERMTGLELREA